MIIKAHMWIKYDQGNNSSKPASVVPHVQQDTSPRHQTLPPPRYKTPTTKENIWSVVIIIKITTIMVSIVVRIIQKFSNILNKRK